MAQWHRAEVTGQGPVLLHSRTSHKEALKVRHFHLVRRPTVPEGAEDISTKIIPLPHRVLGLPTIRNSTAHRSRSTVHSLLVLRSTPISHTYRLRISQLAASTSQVTEVNLTRHLHLTPRINLLLLHHPDHTSRDMAITFLPRSDQTQDHNTRMLPQSYRIGNNHYPLYRIHNLHLQDRPIHRPLLRLRHFHQAGMRSLRMSPQRPRNLIRKEFQHRGVQETEPPIVRLPCITNCLRFQATHRTVVRASHLQLSIAGLLV